MTWSASTIFSVTVLAALFAVLGYLAWRGRSPRMRLVARIALVTLAVATLALIWAVHEFVSNFSIPPM